MPFHSGQGGSAQMGAGGAVIDVTDWNLTISSRLAETTNSGSGGYAQWQAVLQEGSGSFNVPWDSDQIFGVDVALGPTDQITELRLFLGDSTKFFAFPAAVESIQHIVNTQNDIVRAVFNFKTNGVITYPVT